MKTLTIQDVAKHAGVSAKTVSRVINREGSVRAETRERVLRTINELDYQPNLMARSLGSAKAYGIGLVYDNPNPHYLIALQQGALAVCREMGFDLLIHPCNSHNPKLAEELRDRAHRSRLAGLVLTPPVAEDTTLLRKLSDYGIPLVRVISAAEDPHGKYPCIFVDDRDAAYAITEHLIQLGHTRIGFLWGGKSHSSSRERYAGYKDALQVYGTAYDKELVLQGDYSFDDGFRGARRLLGLAEPPTAIFSSNDEIAAGALAAARAAHLHIPHDLSITGFEDSPFSRQSWPSLTTARQRTDQIAGHAISLLIAHIRGGETVNKGFSPELVVRSSTAPPPTRA